MAETFHGRDYRPIVEDDINAAIRGLRLAGHSTKALLETFNTHIAIDLFASGVIAVGCARRMLMTSTNLLGTLTDEQLDLLAHLDPSKEAVQEYRNEEMRRAEVERERAKGWLFKAKFSRTYTITEGFTRIIRAPSLAEAEAAAANLASGFNSDCPDDCSEDEGGHFETGDFIGEIDSAEVHRRSEPDYVVLDDGQVVPFES